MTCRRKTHILFSVLAAQDSKGSQRLLLLLLLFFFTRVLYSSHVVPSLFALVNQFRSNEKHAAE